MKISTTIFICAAMLVTSTRAQVNCFNNGNITNCSNGVQGQTIRGPYGSTTQFSNGQSANTINGPNGNSSTTFSNGLTGNTIRGPNGVSSTFMSNGKSCQSYPNGQTICN